MTPLEAEKYYGFYLEFENQRLEGWLKSFAIYNFDTTLLATAGKGHQIKEYFRGLRNNSQEQESESNIEEQFEGIDFGK